MSGFLRCTVNCRLFHFNFYISRLPPSPCSPSLHPTPSPSLSSHFLLTHSLPPPSPFPSPPLPSPFPSPPLSLSPPLPTSKRALSDVSEDEWLNIPEVGDARNKRQRNAALRPDKVTPIPDSLLHSAAISTQKYSSLDSRQQKYGGFQTPAPGTITPGFSTSSRIDLNQIGEARNSMLGIKLDQVGGAGVEARTIGNQSDYS